MGIIETMQLKNHPNIHRRRECIINEEKGIKFIELSKDELNEVRTAVYKFDSIKNRGNADEIKDKAKIYKEVLAKHDIKIENVLAFGDTDEIDTKLLERVIPYVNVRRTETIDVYNKIKITHTVKSCKCYVRLVDYKTSYKDPTLAGIIVHDSLQSSWNCAMLKMHKPKYGIMFKI